MCSTVTGEATQWNIWHAKFEMFSKSLYLFCDFHHSAGEKLFMIAFEKYVAGNGDVLLENFDSQWQEIFINIIHPLSCYFFLVFSKSLTHVL